ncbi:Neuronal acetylcholine receptor subunit alpha-10 [Sarcoptes scabiei]|uniref:Neuronal acetylcholine receptor subunit alpha-10 n=1 Tax=Sarcoptes scabiei TaxID=52283 RepID=A0A834RCR3_SARSC|nr:Neuronal acetylcholine receptor subunit alpha-10 [Sarcoptes scabiei]
MKILDTSAIIVKSNLPGRTTSISRSLKPSTLPNQRYGASHNLMKSSNSLTHQARNPPISGTIDYGSHLSQPTQSNDYASEQTNDERRLLTYLMRNYDNTIRPVNDAMKPINIRLGITLTQIFDLDEKNQVLTTNIWLDQEWIDEFLTWNSTEFGNITKIRIPCQNIWLPDIVLYNNADDYTRGYMNSRAIIESNGNVFWPPPTKFRSTCQVDVTYFPFDDQKCILKLGSWIYDGNNVNIENRTQNVDLANYVPNGEWDLVQTSLIRNVVFYPCCVEPFPDVTITLVIRRKILYYMYNVIVPCLMMSLLTLLVFCLPPESGEKIALGVTVLLAFSVFMLAISEKLPETSESIPLLGIYLTVVMGITSISIVMTVLVLNFHYCYPLNKFDLPEWIIRLISNENDRFVWVRKHSERKINSPSSLSFRRKSNRKNSNENNQCSIKEMNHINLNQSRIHSQTLSINGRRLNRNQNSNEFSTPTTSISILNHQNGRRNLHDEDGENLRTRSLNGGSIHYGMKSFEKLDRKGEQSIGSINQIDNPPKYRPHSRCYHLEHHIRNRSRLIGQSFRGNQSQHHQRNEIHRTVAHKSSVESDNSLHRNSICDESSDDNNLYEDNDDDDDGGDDDEIVAILELTILSVISLLAAIHQEIQELMKIIIIEHVRISVTIDKKIILLPIICSKTIQIR